MSSEKEILGLEDKRFAAMIARDFAALEKLTHDQLLYTHSSGVTDTKASWLESIKSGKAKYKSVNCSERKVRFFGEVALVNGKAAIEVDIDGQPKSLRLLFLNAWTRTPQGWKFVAWQSCPQPGLRREGIQGSSRGRPSSHRPRPVYRGLEPAGPALRLLPALRSRARRDCVFENHAALDFPGVKAILTGEDTRRLQDAAADGPLSRQGRHA